MRSSTILTLLFGAAVIQVACGQQKPRELQIAEAVAALPAELREQATVLGYRGTSTSLVELRPGTNAMICLADAPGDDRFHVACYHESLEPFMARGRELRKEGKDSPEMAEIRRTEIESGSLPFPDHPAALYSVSGGTLNIETGEIEDGRALQVVYTPYATPESTGLTTSPEAAGWLMYPGEPWAHVMITQ